jgi:hypothetical protein
MGTTTTADVWRGPWATTPHGKPRLKYRGTFPLETAASLPPLPAAQGADLNKSGPSLPKAPSWSPVRVALPLFAAVWVCFAALAAAVTVPLEADVAGLGYVLSMGSGVVALVLITLSVAHTQVSGIRPRLATIGIVALGLGQGLAAQFLASGPGDLWSVGAWVFVVIGLVVPLAWVGGQFQSGIRQHRVEREESLTSSWIARARHQATETVQSAHRHDARSMLFVIDGAARTLADPTLSAEQRESFAEMLAEGVQRLGALLDVRSGEIEPFAVDGVARAVVHAERKAGRPVKAEVPALTALGRAADVTAVLRTLVSAAAGEASGEIRLRGEVLDGAVVVRVEPADAGELPLFIGNWEEIRPETFKPMQKEDDVTIDLYVAARLLADQGADVWSVTGRARFAVRLPLVSVSGDQEEA